MANLTANQRSFIEMMQLSDEHAIRGFDLLLKRPRFLDFFEPLIVAGLFAPEKNPAPVQADKGYAFLLEALTRSPAPRCGQHNDAVLAERFPSSGCERGAGSSGERANSTRSALPNPWLASYVGRRGS